MIPSFSIFRFFVSKGLDNFPFEITETECVISISSSRSWEIINKDVPSFDNLIRDSLINDSA